MKRDKAAHALLALLNRYQNYQSNIFHRQIYLTESVDQRVHIIAAETSKKDGQQEPGRSLDTQAGEGADYGASHCIQQVTFEGAKASAQARGKTSRSYRRQQQRNRAAEEAARDTAGEAPWALLVGEEWEDGQQQEPAKDYDDWGHYCQATDGDGYHPSCNLR